MKEYFLKNHYSKRQQNAQIKYIVVHYSGVAGVNGRAQIIAKSLYRTALKKSIHYLVGDDDIFQLVKDKYKSWHVGGFSPENKCDACNNNSIGVELVEYKRNVKSQSVNDCDWYFSGNTIQRGAKLIAELADRYNVPTSRIIRHYDVTGKRCPRPFVGFDINEITCESHNFGWMRFIELIKIQRGEA